MVGSVEGARAALAGELTWLGEGSFRTAYVDYEEFVVYKVEYGEGIIWANNNQEWNTYNNLVELPNGFDVPDMSIYNVDGIPVIAAQLINGVAMGDCYDIDSEHDHSVCLSDSVARKLMDQGIDTTYGNIIKSGDTYYVVDLG